MISAVIFDMDGVIFDSERACLAVWEENAKKYNMTDVEEVFNRCVGTTKVRTAEIIEDFYREKHGPGISGLIMEDNSRLFHERYDGGRLPLKPGAKEILEFLKKSPFRTGLASSTRRDTIITELKEAGLLQYFDEITGGDEAQNSKPAPDIYLAAAKKLGVEPNESFAIEDSCNGIRSAHAAGMRAIMVPDMIPPDYEMRELSEVILDSLFEVKKYISGRDAPRLLAKRRRG